jgi:hypothetical protein
MELVKVTSQNKDGITMADQFESVIDCVENKYQCTVFYFMTDCDSGIMLGTPGEK